MSMKREGCEDSLIQLDVKRAASTVSKGLFIPDDLAKAMADAASYSSGSHTNVSALSNNRGFHREVPLKTLCVQNLPEWADEDGLKDLFTRSSTTALESIIKTGSNLDANKVIKQVHIVRDHHNGKCVGYAYVEFMDHASAAEALSTFSNSDCFLPGSNRLLKLDWAQSSPNLSGALTSYDFYIGNLRPGLTEKFVCGVLKSIHEGVSAVRLVPQELLGASPAFCEDSLPNEPYSECSNDFYVSCAFYRLGNKKKIHKSSKQQQSNDSDNLKTQETTHQNRHWSCGFVRLQTAFLPQRKQIFETLCKALNTQAGDGLRRHVLSSSYNLQDKLIKHVSTEIFLRFLNNNPNDPCHRIPQKPSTSRQGQHPGGSFPTLQLPCQPTTQHLSDTPMENQQSLFVSNLQENENEKSLALLFAPFGTIVSLRIVPFKRIAFIELASHICALAALCHLRDCVYRDQKLHVSWGRGTIGSRVGAKSSDALVTRNHTMTLQEKSYASKWSQAMQPQVIHMPLPSQTTNCEELGMMSHFILFGLAIPPSEDKEQRKLFLASLYMSLPDPDGSSVQQ